jgi:carboxymethylenebutenolidase
VSEHLHEEWIALNASDGHRLDAFKLVPHGPARGAVIVLQEIFGVNPHIRSVCRRIANEGYTVLAPALFDRMRKDVSLKYDQEGVQEGLALKAAVSFDAALLDVAAALDHCGPAAILGFCWGGTLAWLAAAKLPARGAIAYYGGQIGSFLDVQLKAPVLTHFGEHDHSIPLTVAQGVSEMHPCALNHVYPAGHGFQCDERESYHAASADAAWTRTTGFLKALF